MAAYATVIGVAGASRTSAAGRTGSINNNNSAEAAAAAAAAVEPMLTPEEAVVQLRALRERIPDFVQLPNTRSTRELRRKARLKVEFAPEAFGVVGASEVVHGVIANSPDELHQAEIEMARWIAVESELNALLRGVAAANLVRRERLAQAALQAYNVSSQLVKQEEFAFLLPHVERMRRLPKSPPPTRRRGARLAVVAGADAFRLTRAGAVK